MAWQTWVILALIALSYYQYAYPESSHKRLEAVWGKVEDFVGARTTPKEEEKDSICPDVDNKVCGSDGNTYKNMCEAALAGILQATSGECE